MPIEPPEGEKDRSVDADHVSGEIEHRSAGIAAVNRRIRLQKVIIGSGMDIARGGGNDPGCNRAAETEWIADRQYPVTYLRLCRNLPSLPRVTESSVPP